MGTGPQEQAPDGELRQIVAIVHGRVQGVNFRYHARARARSLGLGGHVRNLPDGSVEVVARGAEQPLRALLAWLHRGPSLALVSRVDVTWQAAAGPQGDFEVRG
jgi:acylphosphatase